MHHPTFSTNSPCRLFGKQDCDRADESRNLAWLAIPTWGRRGTTPTTPSRRPPGTGPMVTRSTSAQSIELMEKLGIAYDVGRVGPARRARKPWKAVS